MILFACWLPSLLCGLKQTEFTDICDCDGQHKIMVALSGQLIEVSPCSNVDGPIACDTSRFGGPCYL